MDHHASLPAHASHRPAGLTVDDVQGAILMVASGLARAVQLSGVSFDGAAEDASRMRASLARVGFSVERNGRPMVAVIVGPRLRDDE